MTDAELTELEQRWVLFGEDILYALHGGENRQGHGELHRDDDCTPITTLEAIHLAEGPRDVATLLAEVRRLRVLVGGAAGRP